MLYQELLKLTNNKATYEQYREIDKVYMSKNAMTKKQAANLWKRHYDEKENKPRADEMRRIKEAIRNFKHESKNAKDAEYYINKKYGDLIVERLFDFYGKTLEEISNEPKDSIIAWLARQTIDRIEKEREQAIYRWYEDAGNDTTIYIIYRDGSTLFITGTEIVSGGVTPKTQNVAYALYMDGYEHFDTEIGDIDKGLYGKTAVEYDFDITDEMLEIKEKYESYIEIKYRTEWGLKHKQS